MIDPGALTVFVLVPDLDESVAFSGSREKSSVGAERHVVNGRRRVTLPHALPRLFLSLVLLIVWCFWVAAANFEFH